MDLQNILNLKYMISEKNLQKFMDLYEKEYGVKLTRQEAFNLFSRFVNIVRIVYETKD